jgi:hypothetical protein
MRLTSQQAIMVRNDLIAMLAEDREWDGRGLRTLDMWAAFQRDSPLSLKQIARLLRATGKVVAKPGNSKGLACKVWTLTDEAWEEAFANPDSLYESQDPRKEIS